MKIRLLSVLGLVVGLSMGALATGANAATVGLNNSTSQTLNLGDVGTFGANHSSSFVNEDWLFDVSSAATGVGFVLDVSLFSGDIDNLVGQVFDLTNNSVVGTTSGPDNSLSIFGSNLIAGVQYAVRVSGDVTAGTGSYAGGIFISSPLPPAVVPVPPALLLFGSALTGLFCVGRRRKSDSAA